MDGLNKLLNHINITQDYKNVQGSIFVGFENERFVTDVWYQLNVRLSLRAHSVRKSTYRKYASLIGNMQRYLHSIGSVKIPVEVFKLNHANILLTWITISPQYQ